MKVIEDESLEISQEERIRQFEEKKKNYKGIHCCLVMDNSVDRLRRENLSPCFYNPKFREYYLKETQGPGAREINFCPYCGATLPRNLSDIWFDVLEKELGLDHPTWPEQKKKIPKEFLTDEWWKKRGF